jgi:hypothetical protein
VAEPRPIPSPSSIFSMLYTLIYLSLSDFMAVRSRCLPWSDCRWISVEQAGGVRGWTSHKAVTRPSVTSLINQDYNEPSVYRVAPWPNVSSHSMFLHFSCLINMRYLHVHGQSAALACSKPQPWQQYTHVHGKKTWTGGFLPIYLG